MSLILIDEEKIDELTPDKAMQRTSLRTPFFACAKKLPPAIGRLSRRDAAFSAASLGRRW